MGIPATEYPSIPTSTPIVPLDKAAPTITGAAPKPAIITEFVTVEEAVAQANARAEKTAEPIPTPEGSAPAGVAQPDPAG